MRVANERKSKVLATLASYRNALRKLFKRNRTLLPSQVIPIEDFEIDDRVTWDLDESLEMEMELVERKMAFDLAKSTRALEKAREFFIDPIRNLQIELRAIKITEEKQAFNILDREITHRVGKIESFLVGLSSSTIEFGLGTEINRVLKKYRDRRVKKANRQLQWDELNAVKPDPNKHHPDDLAALEQARKTIGDYKLKTDDDYKVPEEEKHTTLTKYQQLINIREEMFKLQNNFNEQVFELRESKLILTSKIVAQKAELQEIQEELLPEFVKPLPIPPEIDVDTEFPERALKVRIITTDPATGRKRRASTIYDRVKPVVRGKDLEKEVLGVHGFETEKIIALMEKNEPKTVDIPSLTLDSLISMAQTDESETPWELELKRLRQNRKNYEQTRILNDIEESIRMFDENVAYYAELRITLDVHVKYLELFLLTLHQELMILKEFEANEVLMLAKVQDKINEKNAVVKKQNELKFNIEARQRLMLQNVEVQKNLQINFMAAVADNKFVDYLKGIFKKKYKPPKDVNDESDEESSESSEESSEEDLDAASLSSGDIGLIKLDESVCPEGCDVNLYNLAFELRAQRHELEMKEKEEQRQIDLTNKEVNVMDKQIRVIEEALRVRREELAAYQRLKQQKLNDVQTTVVLRLHQIQNLSSDGSLDSFEDSLVFSRGAIGSLFTRVGELKHETELQKEKHKKNQRHLWRMNQDCLVMEERIRKLRESIAEVMYRKFNQIIDLDQLEEAILKKLVHDLRFRMADVQKSYDKEIAKWKQTLCTKQLEMSSSLEQNTEKLEVLTVLQEESLKLSKILKHQAASKEVISKADEIEKIYKSDMKELKSIEKRQEEQLMKLRQEIRRLKLKSEPLPPITTRPKTSVKVASEDSFSYFSFSDYPPPPKKEPRYKAMYSAFHIFYNLIDRVGGQIGSSMLVSRKIVKELMNSVDGAELAHSTIEDILFQVNNELESIENYNSIKEVLQEVLDRTMEGPSITIPIIDDILVKVIEQTPEFIMVKNLVDQLLSRVDIEAHKERFDLVKDILKIILDHFPTDKKTIEDLEESVTSMVEPMKKAIPSKVVEMTPQEELEKQIRRLIYNILEQIEIIQRETEVEVAQIMFPTEAPPNFEEMISQDIIDEVINRVMDNFSLTESAMQIAIENAIKEMIKKIPEKLIRIRYNLFQVAREMVRRMSITSMEIMRVKGDIIVDNLTDFIEREGPENLTRSKIEQIVGNIITYIKEEALGE
ncbi:cilia- and flagella-associated protein 44-like [Ctenocephalides felis]|uniref:cilia- and flagella-associated protein 44-like n=1 Tax=Ctenocephalides felis TaxID=7515 RepID=UPI000E6E1EEE|nr:cilia- and flagella-associated protein 44-like [Ctenocephalides felis]